MDAEEFSGHVLKSIFHVTEKYAATYYGMTFWPAITIGKYLAGARQSIQGPISYFLFSYIIFSTVAHLARRANIEAGTFGTINQYLVIFLIFGVVIISWLIAMRPKFCFVEALVSFFYLYGTVFPALTAFVLLQLLVSTAALGLPNEWKFLYVDTPFVLMGAGLALRFSIEVGISIRKFVFALLLIAAYLLVVRNFFVQKLPFGI